MKGFTLKRVTDYLVQHQFGLSCIGAVLFFIFSIVAFAKNSVLIGIELLALTAACVVNAYFTYDRFPNFFLYDRQKSRNIPINRLTFEKVNDKMNFLITCLPLKDGREEDLWESNILEEDGFMGPRRVYRYLIAFKMLYNLADRDCDWNWLMNSKNEVRESIYSALSDGDEAKFVEAMKFLMNNYASDDSKIRQYLLSNKKYMQSRMVKYVRENISLFY